jgi:hypothetical protein
MLPVEAHEAEEEGHDAGAQAKVQQANIVDLKPCGREEPLRSISITWQSFIYSGIEIMCYFLNF